MTSTGISTGSPVSRPRRRAGAPWRRSLVSGLLRFILVPLLPGRRGHRHAHAAFYRAEELTSHHALEPFALGRAPAIMASDGTRHPPDGSSGPMKRTTSAQPNRFAL